MAAAFREFAPLRGFAKRTQPRVGKPGHVGTNADTARKNACATSRDDACRSHWFLGTKVPVAGAL